jgi:hypothetical protein
MRTFMNIAFVVLILVAGLSLYVGFKVLGEAETSVQEIEGLITLVVFAVSLGCAGIMAALTQPGATRRS